MTRDEMSHEAFTSLSIAIGELLMNQGLKATTMDSIANALQMSKRTLYEVFNSKNEMIISAVEALHEKHASHIKEIFASSSNVMEGMLKGFIYHRDMMRKTNIEFIKDMDSLFSEVRLHSNKNSDELIEKYVKVLEKGVKQGFFRKDVNFTLQCRLLWIQMESLKRMEELFPPDLTLLEAYDSINISFLRAISTNKGQTMLEKVVEYLQRHNNQTISTLADNENPI